VAKVKGAVLLQQRRGEGCSSLSEAMEPPLVGGYTSLWDAWPVRRQTYGYLPGRTALSLHLSRYSFPIPQRVGGWVGRNGWSHTKTTNPRTGHAFQH